MLVYSDHNVTVAWQNILSNRIILVEPWYFLLLFCFMSNCCPAFILICFSRFLSAHLQLTVSNFWLCSFYLSVQTNKLITISPLIIQKFQTIHLSNFLQCSSSPFLGFFCLFSSLNRSFNFAYKHWQLLIFFFVQVNFYLHPVFSQSL